ncbi:Bestrophin, RFP-TM, chloride channel-domain-containing protein [Mycena albidolilacea]|uniref:Bestrophin, RFP-TM, chloride channel-domain-containing protein n=1 Tax=Mycena albidolilacea TaxID=1033008 RepID=A0AAD6ZKL7_9AGAR|nr:Bestrophin, RFP-TM, chloride channel-domain-containing protein [Mycena albidolilacea]
MGIDVELGERAPSDLPPPIRAPQALPPTQLVPTANINLDSLSVLIALVSDLTHAPLPASVEEAQLRFSAPQRIRESNPLHEFADTATPARALTSQIMQEMLQEMGRGGMFQELHARLLPLLPPNGTSPLQTWTTAEAHERFMRIVAKIGGPGEKQRAETLQRSGSGFCAWHRGNAILGWIALPLPFAYQAHLRMSLWLYLLVLPFQLVGSLHYLTIPGTTFASFLLLGFLEIGQEIENPFNYDENDLDLDHFCLSIQRELHEVTAHTMPDPSTFVFTSWNQPFAPADRRNAEELTANAQEEYEHSDHADAEPGLATIRRMLLKSWRDVDRITREG